jgi:hypothetical protein
MTWPATYADERARYAFEVGHLPDHHLSELLGIPGVQRRGTSLTAPWSAAAPFDAAARGLGVSAAARPLLALPSRTLPTDPDAALASMLDGSFMRPWTWQRSAAGKRFALDYQARCVQFGVQQGSANVWAAPGSGKTLIALMWAASTWRDRPAGANGPIVVVTRRTAAIQWCRQVARFCDGADALELRPESLRRKSDPDPESWIHVTLARGLAPIVIASWGELVERHPQIIAWRPSCVVFDEAHFAKDHKRKKWTRDVNDRPVGHDLETRSTAAMRIAQAVPRRLGTTASPIANTLPDLWGQLTLIEPWAWGLTASKFLLRYCGARPGEHGGLVTGAPTNTGELVQRIAWSSISIPYATSHAELPPKRREVRRIPVDEQDAEIGGDQRELAQAIKANDPNRTTEIRLSRNATRKRSAVVDLVNEYRDARASDAGLVNPTAPRGKVIVFDGRKRNVEALAKSIGGRCRGVDVITATGDNTPTEIADAVAAFMSHPGPCALVATWQKLGSSIDLQDADGVVWAMLPWTPEAVEQGEGRADRLGMTRPLVYHYLVALETTDEHVAGILLDKLPAVEEITPGRRLEAHGSLRAQLAREDETDAILDALAERIANAETWDD